MRANIMAFLIAAGITGVCLAQTIPVRESSSPSGNEIMTGNADTNANTINEENNDETGADINSDNSAI